jgi:hypothetical protein
MERRMDTISYEQFVAGEYRHLYSLNIVGVPNDIEDVEIFRGVRGLDLTCCFNIEDWSPLSDIEELNLSCTFIEDVSHLGRVKRLDLTDCVQIENVSSLGDVHTLILRRCTGIKDISHLGNNRYLDLRGIKVGDISHLKSVGTLVLDTGKILSKRPPVYSPIYENRTPEKNRLRNVFLKNVAVSGKSIDPYWIW